MTSERPRAVTGIEVDSTKLLILMSAGGVFAVLALYLMLLSPVEGAAKIEMFGQKFGASSGGILVFLVGAALLTLPRWVRESVAELWEAGFRAAGHRRVLIRPGRRRPVSRSSPMTMSRTPRRFLSGRR